MEVVPVIVAAKLGRCERAARRKRDYGREEGKEERVESARARSETTFGVFVDSGVEHGLRHRQCPDNGKNRYAAAPSVDNQSYFSLPGAYVS